MSVLIETSLGDLVVDLDTEKCPRTCENFLKLCKSYRYNYLTFFSVQRDFVAQTGDPTNSGNGGQSVWSLLDPSAPKYTKEQYFYPERHASIRHNARGTLSMACRRLASNGRTFEAAEDEDAEGDPKLVAGSQFFVTLADNIDQLDDKHAPFGRVVEGQEKDGTLDKINAAFVDKTMRPLRDIRIQHVVVLDDPYQDPLGLHIPSHTPSPTPEQMAPIGLDANAELNDAQDKPEDEVQEERRKRDTNAAALTLEMVGDLPFAEVRPPENILFVCKLNPVTQSEDLELIFSRFGKILTCEVIRDRKTGDSLQYAFIEFDEQKSAEQAYFKMQNVLVDDRRIWVDFSQSVSKLSNTWNSGRAHGKPLKVTESKTSNGSGSSSSRQKHDSYNGGQRSSGEKDFRRQRDYRRSDYDRKSDDRYHSTKYEDRSGTSDSRSDRYDRQRRDFDRQGDRYERRDRERHEPYDRNRIEYRYRGNERYERSRSERHRDQRSPSPRQRRRDRD